MPPQIPPATGQSAARPGSLQPVRSPGERALRRRCRIGPRSPATARPSRAGSGRVWRASRGRGGAGLGRGALPRAFRCFYSFSFVFFRFVSFCFVSPAGNGRRAAPRSRHAAVPAGDAPNEPNEPLPHRESPNPWGHRPSTPLRRGVPRPPRRLPADSAPPPQGSAPPRRGERAHRRRGGGSRARHFVVIKILPPRRARTSAEARPRGAGRARRAGECPGAGASRGLPRRFSRVVTVRRLRRLPALSVPFFPRLPPLHTAPEKLIYRRRSPGRKPGPRTLRHSSGVAAPAAGPVPVSRGRRIVPTTPLQTPRHKSRRVGLSLPLPARCRCRPPSSRPETAWSGRWTGKGARRNQARSGPGSAPCRRCAEKPVTASLPRPR